MPEKMTIYSTLVGWLNSQDDKFGEDFLTHVFTELGNMLTSERWEAARYTIRFISGIFGSKILIFLALSKDYVIFLFILNCSLESPLSNCSISSIRKMTL